MKRFITKKSVVIFTIIAAAVAIATGAYAYFSAAGSGSGSASVGSATGWTVTGASYAGDLFPAATAEAGAHALTGGSVKNPGTGKQSLHQIVATIEAPTSVGTDNTIPDCTASDFSFSSPSSSWTLTNSGQTATITPDDDLAPNASYTMSDLSIAMVDSGSNQDNCQGATVNITYDAS